MKTAAAGRRRTTVTGPTSYPVTTAGVSPSRGVAALTWQTSVATAAVTTSTGTAAITGTASPVTGGRGFGLLLTLARTVEPTAVPTINASGTTASLGAAAVGLTVAPVTTLVNETFAGTEGTTVTTEAQCNFDGSFTTLTEHTPTAGNTSNWMMDTGALTRKNGWGWTGKATTGTTGDPYFFRCRTRTAQAAAATIEFDYKVATWASGSVGTNSSADGTAIWLRYVTQWGPLYEAYIDKFDNKIGVKRKVPAIGYTGTGGVSNSGVYYTLKSDAACPNVAVGTLQATYTAVGSTNLVRDAADTTGIDGTSYHFKVTIRTLSTNVVQVQIFRDSVLVWSCTDNNNDCVSESNSISLAADLTAGRYNTADSRWNAATMANPIQVAGYSGMRTDNAQAYYDNVVLTTP